MDKGLKYQSLINLAETVKKAAADGKFTAFEIIGIIIAVFKARKDIGNLRQEIRTAGPGDLKNIFGTGHEKSRALVANVIGLITYGERLADILPDFKEPKKAEPKTKKTTENE